MFGAFSFKSRALQWRPWPQEVHFLESALMLDHPPRSKNRLALITGASSGIGAGFARHAASQGFDVALCARRLDRLEALAKEIKATWSVEAFAVEADLSVRDAPEKIIDSIADRDRSVDVLVNNAGFSIPKGLSLIHI